MKKEECTIGKRVRLLDGFNEACENIGFNVNYDLKPGMLGTVVDPNDGRFNPFSARTQQVGVAWDELTNGHDLYGACEDRKGWGVFVAFLEEVDEVNATEEGGLK